MEKSQNYRRILWVVKSALLIALLVVAQLLSFALAPKGPLVSQLVTGSLVNLVLVVGAGSVGFSGTAVAAVLSPVMAFALGQMKFPQMILVVALGNLVIVAVTWAFFRLYRRLGRGGAGLAAQIAGVVLGAAAKCGFLWAATVLVVVPAFFAGSKAAKQLSLMFSWPQGLTALVGGALALLVLPAIRAYQKQPK